MISVKELRIGNIVKDKEGFHHLQNIAYDLYEISLDLNIFDDDYPGDTSLV